jgi:N-acetylglucosaminyl-diphospho-decaprenol L-rhamnosyltransferase
MAERTAAANADLAVVVVTYNALPWIERCLESVAAYPTVVVDNGSADGTVDFVRERFPEVTVLEQENRGLGAGWNAGLRAAGERRWYLILNADAWVLDDAVARLVAAAEADERVAVVGPRLLNQDGSLQRSVRGFPTVWRLATEFLFLRKLAPRSQALNSFYAGGFAHDHERAADWVMGACLLVRGAAIADVGGLDERFFLFNEEVDWCWRFQQAGWRVLFTPDAEVVHVLGASHGGRLFGEQVVSHVRFLAKHNGAAEADRARRLLVAALRLRGVVFRGERGARYREAAERLAAVRVPELLDAQT